jgi:hypothetical protein
MKIAAALTLCLGAASAFAPPTAFNGKRVASLNMVDMDGVFGTTPESGNKAIGGALLRDAGPGALKWMQNAEVKNGRVAMVATVGYTVQKYGIHFPLYLGPNPGDQWYLSSSAGITFEDVSKAAPLDAIQMVPIQGWLQIFFAAFAFEAVAFERQWNQEREIPGDYGYDPLGFTKREGGWDSDELKDLRMKELKNGRLAM